MNGMKAADDIARISKMFYIDEVFVKPFEKSDDIDFTGYYHVLTHRLSMSEINAFKKIEGIRVLNISPASNKKIEVNVYVD